MFLRRREGCMGCYIAIVIATVVGGGGGGGGGG